MSTEVQVSIAAVASVVSAVAAVCGLATVWWTRRTDAINSVAERYLDLLRRDPHPRVITLLQHSGILTLRSRRQVFRVFQRVYERGGHDVSAHLPSWLTPSNMIMVITAARKHNCDLSTAGGIYKFLTSEWSPLQIRQEMVDTDICSESNT